MDPEQLYGAVPTDVNASYDVREVIARLGDAAAGLGVAVHRTRTLLLSMAIVLAAAATAIAGVVVFVALAAPQIAQRAARLARPPRPDHAQGCRRSHCLTLPTLSAISGR